MPNTQGTVIAVCISIERGTPKKNVGTAEVLSGSGIAGDAHRGDWHRQISLLPYEKIEEFNRLGANVEPGAFGENLVVQGIDFNTLSIGTQISCGTALLEITQIGKECHNHCEIYHKMGDCIMPRHGVFARALSDGHISVGDAVKVESARKPYKAAIITASDKCAKKQRVDQSGPLAKQILEDAGYEVIDTTVLPDEKSLISQRIIFLADVLEAALIITTGGTGFSPRDVTPEATMDTADRNVPGIAEAIRHHSMQMTKRAMLGRGVSVIRGHTLIINLPGSPKAVRESLEFILPEIFHGIEILRQDSGDCAL